MQPAVTEPPLLTRDEQTSPSTLRLAGAWRLNQLRQIEDLLRSLPASPVEVIDASALQEMDSAAALLLLRRLEPAGSSAPVWQGLDPRSARVLAQVRAALPTTQGVPAARRGNAVTRLGRGTLALGSLLLGHLNFLGAITAALGALVVQPSRLRLRELTTQLEQAGLNAIPVVALVTSLIGVVVAYLLGLQAEKYGANIFVVDGVGVGATREFAPIIVAVVVAGRSGAAFTAQLGSMRLTEEVDAIRTLGLDAWQVLVLPRVLALMLALPLLVFVGDVASLLGAMAVTSSMLGISPAAFAARLHESLDMRHVLVGLAKAPVFALAIALIGTRMGMTVGRDTRALGAATTSTVVQSIVAVILLDAVFAILFQALDL